MKQLFTLVTCLSFGTYGFAQCETDPIAFTAVQISTSGTTGIDAADVWVCGGLEVTLVGSLLDVYIEASSYVQIIGNFNTVHVKEGCTINFQGDSSLVFYFPTSVVTVVGTDVLAIPCGEMTFDYTNAPSPPCPGINIGVQEVSIPTINLQLVPNPANDQLMVSTGSSVIHSMSALDPGGRIVQQTSGPGRMMDVSGLATGQYVLRVKTDQGVVLGRFSKL